MKIAIIGGGLAGLASCYYLTSYLGVEVDLYSIPGGASSASTGLLYPFVGKFAQKNWRADEGLAKAKELLSLVEREEGVAVADYRGITKLALLPFQLKAYSQIAKRYQENSWHKESSTLHPFSPYPGVYLPSGTTVFSCPYLTALQSVCRKRGANFIEAKISSLEEVKGYDRVLLTAGADLFTFKEVTGLPLELISGKALLCQLPEGIEPLAMSVISQGHISLTETPGLYLLGSTYEREDVSDRVSIQEIQKKVIGFFKRVEECRLVQILSGVRVCRTDSYIPLIKRISSKVWIYTGLGSRGLLYHAYLAEKAAMAIYQQDENLLPKETRV